MAQGRQPTRAQLGDEERIDGHVARFGVVRRFISRRRQRDVQETARDQRMRGLLMTWYAGAIQRGDPAEISDATEALRLNRVDIAEDRTENAAHDAIEAALMLPAEMLTRIAA